MDGYAVHAKNTFGATESLPALLEIAGEVNPWARTGKMGLKPGTSRQKFPPAACCPKAADGVVMVEYCTLLDEMNPRGQSRHKPPGEHYSTRRRLTSWDRSFYLRESRLRSQDLGVLAGLGFCEIPVFRRPLVAILSTGDEIVPVSGKPRIPGKFETSIGTPWVALCRNMGAVRPSIWGICSGPFRNPCREMAEKALVKGRCLVDIGGKLRGNPGFYPQCL